MPFLIVFLVIPLAEVYVFYVVGSRIGIGTTLLLALLTAIIGGMIVRRQGLDTLRSFRASSEENRLPLREIFDGLCLVAAGALLITPGFVTDTIGFLLLAPPVRGALRKILAEHTVIGAGFCQGGRFYGSFRRPGGGPRDPDVIEGEYERLDETGKKP